MDGNTDMIPQDTQEKPVNAPGLTMISVARARIWPGNPRKTIPDLTDLTESVRKVGVLAPLLMRELREPLITEEGGIITHFVTHEVLAGQCRFLAATAAGLLEVPANVCAVDDAVALELALTENFGRNDSPPLEDAEALHTLITKHGRTVEQVSASIGKPVQWVRQRLSLLALGERARGMLSSGDLPLRHAYLCAAVDRATQERALSRWDGMDLPPARVFAREITSALRTLQSAPFDITDEKLLGGPCSGCSRRTDAQTDLFGGAETGARCLGAECWDGKVAAVWERAQKGAKRRKGLAVIQDFVTLSHDHTCVVRGDVLTARAREGAEVIAIARTAWGKVVELYEPEEHKEKAAPAKVSAESVDRPEEDSPEDAARSAQKAQESARKAAAAEEKRATLARLYNALTGSRTGLHTGLRVALLTCARDLEMSRDLRAVCEATGRNVFTSPDAEVVAGIADGDLAVMLVATIVSAWALDKDAEDGTVMERSLREMLRAREREESAEEPVETVESIAETGHTGADVTHAIHPETGAVVMGDDVERITPAQETTEKAEKPAAAKKSKKGGRK